MRLPTNQLVEKYKDNLFAIAFNICKNPEDAEDIIQDTFVEYFSSHKDFKDEEHIRAWLIRVTINKSKNILKVFWRKRRVSESNVKVRLSRGRAMLKTTLKEVYEND